MLVSCKSKWQKEYEQQVENRQKFESQLEAHTGKGHTLAKISGADGQVYLVYKLDATGEYVSYNYSLWNPASLSLDTYVSTAVEGSDIIRNLERKQQWETSGYNRDITETQYRYVDEWESTCSCYKEVYKSFEVVVGYEWVDTSGYVAYYHGGGFIFNNTGGSSKDLETYGASREDQAAALLSEKITSDFALSESRADELAKMVVRYKKLENTRELTAKEKDKFALDALGVSMTQMENAIVSKAQGSDKQYQQMLEKAAQVNNTSPETIGRFFDLINE